MATNITFSIDRTPCTKPNSMLIIKQNRMELKCSTIFLALHLCMEVLHVNTNLCWVINVSAYILR